jgi:predicted metal-binding membrane protein
MQMTLRIDRRRPLVALVLGTSAAAWLALWAWENSPYARYLSHPSFIEPDAPATGLWAWLCAPGALNGRPTGVLLPALFLAGWVLMVAAMMLPTTLPLLVMFQRMTQRQPHQARLIAALVIGYVSVWTLGGIAIHGAYEGWIALLSRLPGLRQHAWAMGASVLLLAGLYQLSPLKRYCLERCRSPLSFITRHARAASEALRAAALGAHHGLFCVGCCWSLMLLMGIVGSSNLGWMFALGAVMAVEKNASWGRRISAPLAVLLLVAGCALLLAN